MITVELTFERNKRDKKPFSRMYEQNASIRRLTEPRSILHIRSAAPCHHRVTTEW